MSSIGLNREGVYQLPIAEDYGFRKTLCVCYHMEKWASLCHGIPSTLGKSPEVNTIISELNDVGSWVYTAIPNGPAKICALSSLEPFLSGTIGRPCRSYGANPEHV